MVDVFVDDIIKTSDGSIYLTTDGSYPESVFRARFSEDRYGVDAKVRAVLYGQSLVGSIINFRGKDWSIIDFSVMEGSMGYVGSLVLRVEEKPWLREEDFEL